MVFGFKALYISQPQSETLVMVNSEAVKSIATDLPERISYNFDVKPILSDKCYTCHGPDPKTTEGDLRLDTSNHWYRTSEADPNKQIIFPGEVSKSELVDRIRSTKASHQMPPPESNLELTRGK